MDVNVGNVTVSGKCILGGIDIAAELADIKAAVTVKSFSEDKDQAVFDYFRSMADSQKRCAVALECICKFLTRATDLDIVFGKDAQNPTKGSDSMASNKKGTAAPVKVKMVHRGKGAVMPDITLTAVPSSITLQPIDDNKNPVTIQPSDSVTGTLSSDSASFAIGAGSDSLHYTATIPANTPQGTVANLAATCVGTIQGAPADLTASVKVTLNIPPSPVATDLDIIIA